LYKKCEVKYEAAWSANQRTNIHSKFREHNHLTWHNKSNYQPKRSISDLGPEKGRKL
jgi:hypothetical protein